MVTVTVTNNCTISKQLYSNIHTHTRTNQHGTHKTDWNLRYIYMFFCFISLETSIITAFKTLAIANFPSHSTCLSLSLSLLVLVSQWSICSFISMFIISRRDNGHVRCVFHSVAFKTAFQSLLFVGSVADGPFVVSSPIRFHVTHTTQFTLQFGRRHNSHYNFANPTGRHTCVRFIKPEKSNSSKETE